MRLLLVAIIFAAGCAAGIGVERWLAADACLDAGGAVRGGLCRGLT
ncbi:MAG: hypothetical protein Q4G14_02085 [Paracoccus sp. (in: a-proteobacteria)]|nr:hypothetical protein [Paracoccus sp. (in: a-proteobacteria)]MDO5612015.1 hypothetical protein [Paracoccus sp. (in: a-proteobacteria)]